jgi:Helix-turn-helix domain
VSVDVMSRVWRLKLPHNEKFVLLAFADHANDDGLCFPSIARIAWKCQYSERGIQNIVASLKVKGLIEIVTQGGGRGVTPRYIVRPEKGEELAPFGGERVNARTERVQSTTQKGEVATAPESSSNHQRQPSGSGATSRFYVSFNGGTKDGAFLYYPTKPNDEIILGDETYRYLSKDSGEGKGRTTLHYELVSA